MESPGSRLARRRRSLPQSERHPRIFVVYKLLEHLAFHRDNKDNDTEECRGRCTPYHLSVKIYDLNEQKQDRVQMMLELLRNNGFVTSDIQVSHGTYYSITDVGYAWYRDKAVPFMIPMMPMFFQGRV